MRWRRSLNFAVSIFTVCSPFAVSAKPSPRWTHYGLRPLAMGNAFVAVVDDYNTVFYNPAGLARLSTWDLEILNPYAEGSTGIKTAVSDAQNSKNSGVSGVLDLIEKNAGESFHLGIGIEPHFVMPKFGFAIGADLLEATAIFHRDISIDVKSGSDIVFPISYAFNLLNDRLSIGLSLKARAKAGVDREFSIDDIEALQSGKNDSSGKKLDDYVLTGAGGGADVGILFTPTKTMEPTLGVSITDLGGTAYKDVASSTKGVGIPPVTQASVNVGFSMKPIMINKLYLLTAVDVHSINQNISFSKKLSLGSELGYGRYIKLQAGLYEGYLTGGIQFDVPLIKIKLVTYAEELGDNAGFKEDRRVAVQLKLLL